MNSEPLLDSVYEYRRLLTRRDLMRVGLSPASSARLRTLEDALADRGEVLRRRFIRRATRVDVQLHVGDELVDAQLVDIGAGGIRLRVGRAVAADVSAIVRIPIAGKHIIYQFQVETRWGAADVVGMPFVGLPRVIPTGVSMVPSEDSLLLL